MTKILPLTPDQSAHEQLARQIDDFEDEASIFVLLARHARGRNPYGLFVTAVGGVADAAFIWSRYHGLHWLAAGFAAVAAYGVWALADFGFERRAALQRRFDLARDFLGAIRVLSVPAGVIAAIAAVGGFMAAALGGWQH